MCLALISAGAPRLLGGTRGARKLEKRFALSRAYAPLSTLLSVLSACCAPRGSRSHLGGGRGANNGFVRLQRDRLGSQGPNNGLGPVLGHLVTAIVKQFYLFFVSFTQKFLLFGDEAQ